LLRYGVDYLVVGPYERREFGANLGAYQARYPSLIRTPNYEIFAVRQVTAWTGGDSR
jgi:hypothetical protein